VLNDKTLEPAAAVPTGIRLADYVQLGKLRLSLVVVFSAGMAYLIGSPEPTDWLGFAALNLGGLLVTLSANAWNELIEVRTDALMARTAQRPLPTRRMARRDAVLFGVGAGLLGLLILALGANVLCGALALLSLVLYAAVYTPLKRVGSICVLVGAVPGALPVVIGWAAARGSLGPETWLLFALQFVWQLPHFFAIAWLAHDEYRKAGFSMLPWGGTRSEANALTVLLYTLLLIPLAWMPHELGLTGTGATYALLFFGLLFTVQAIGLWAYQTRASALQLMFGSFLYLPAALISILLDRANL
jgi:protoheme IX farnesyltransferase